MHQPFHTVEVFQGGVLGAGRQNFNAQLTKGIHHRPGLDASGKQHGPLSLKTGAEGSNTGTAEILLFSDERSTTVLHGAFFQAADLIVQLSRNVPERLGRVGHAIKRFLKIGHAIALLHLFRQIGQ